MSDDTDVYVIMHKLYATLAVVTATEFTSRVEYAGGPPSMDDVETFTDVDNWEYLSEL